MFPKKKLIFATTKTGNIYLEKDLKSFPEEYLESVEECLSNLENGFIEENNQQVKKLDADAKLSGMHEIKTFKVRVFYKNLAPDTVYIMMARMKKSTNDLIDRSEPVERNKKTTGEFEKLKEEIKDPIKKEQLIEQNNEIRKRIKEHIKENRRGKKSLELNKLQYTMEIINGIGIAPSVLPELLGELELTEEDFFAHLSGNIPTNISLYDQTLQLVTEKQQDKLPKKVK